MKNRSGRGRACVLAYHEILPRSSRYLYHVSTGQFEQHLRSFSAAEGVMSTPEITFDDGHRSNAEFALPLLNHSQRKAVFFVVAGSIGQSADCISWQQAARMISEGHRVESHGLAHRMLTQCSTAELEREVIASREEIESRLGFAVTAISVPGGRWNMRVVEMCARAGYTTLFHSNPWTPERTLLGVTLRGRLMVNKDMRGEDLLKLAHASSMTRIQQHTKYTLKQTAQKVVGDELYHSIWCRLARFKPGDGMELESAADRSAELR